MGVLESVVRRMWCGCAGECCEENVMWVCVPDIVVRRMWCGCVYQTLS